MLYELVDKVPAAETVDQVQIPGRIKPNTIKIGIRNFPFDAQ